MHLRKTFLLFFIGLLSYAHAQKPLGSIGLRGTWGSFLTPQPKTQYIHDSYTYFAEAEWLSPKKVGTKGDNGWGISAFFGNSGSRKYLGNFGGLFGTFSIPVAQRGWWRLLYRTGAGVGWVQKPFDLEDNYKNVVIGSALNAFIQLSLDNHFYINKNWQAVAGFSLSHLSNGSVRLPNAGMNIPAFTLGVHYGYNHTAQKPDSIILSSGRRSINLFSGLGTTQRPFVGSKQHTVISAQAEYEKRLSGASAWQAGAAYFYNPALFTPNPDIGDTARRSESQVALYGGYVYHLSRHFSFPLQVGVYVYNAADNPPVYQQLGLRYAATKKLFLQLNLKTHYGKAEYIHTGAGYRF